VGHGGSGDGHAAEKRGRTTDDRQIRTASPTPPRRACPCSESGVFFLRVTPHFCLRNPYATKAAG
jgi:hypothetical protein